MADMSGRKVFKVFNQDFIVDERYTVTKELGQGAYGIVWYGSSHQSAAHSLRVSYSVAASLQELIYVWTVLLQTTKPEKVWPSRKSPMFSARRF
jgi:hypothetical protein